VEEDMRRKDEVILYSETEEGDEVEIFLPTKKEVCGRCHGEGKHVNPSIDGNGITGEEWSEWGDEERETYMSGGYDVTCEECDGANVVTVVDWEVPWASDKAEDVELKRRYRRQLKSFAQLDQYERMERMMGA
jgi:hypothetical protein